MSILYLLWEKGWEVSEITSCCLCLSHPPGRVRLCHVDVRLKNALSKRITSNTLPVVSSPNTLIRGYEIDMATHIYIYIYIYACSIYIYKYIEKEIHK